MLVELLEDEVEQDLEEDEEEDDGDVSVRQKRTFRRRLTGHATPQRTDAPVNVLLGLSDGLNGTLDFAQIGSFLPVAAAVFAFVPLAA